MQNLKIKSNWVFRQKNKKKQLGPLVNSWRRWVLGREFVVALRG
jgi:hypothetical protein